MTSPHESPLEAQTSRPRVRAIAAAAAVVAVALVAVGVVRAENGSADQSCDTTSRPLSVAAAPEIAAPIRDLARGDDCMRVVVTAADPAATAAALSARKGDRPDVWVPDSSAWESLAGLTAPPHDASIARTPVVVAIPEDLAGGRATDLSALLPRVGAAGAPVRFSVPDPEHSATTLGLLTGVQSALAHRPDGRAALAVIFRAAERTHARPDQLLTSLRRGTPTAVPGTEQQVFARNAQRPDTRAVAAYLPGAGYALDYPYVVLSPDAAHRARAAKLLGQLTGTAGRDRLRRAGFRDPSGTAGPALTTAFGVDAARPGNGPTPDAARVASAINTLAAIQRGTRLLAVIDVSGSMAEPIPGSRTTSKMALVLGAAVSGLGMYPDSTQAGLWTFSTNLTRDTDYRQLVPVMPLGMSPDGTTGRMRLGAALAAVRPIPGGGTGLYDTALAAVRTQRQGWSPDAVNSVVLLTDGRNEDPHGITLDQLVKTLRAENDPARPVYLITIGYGAGADTAALAAMSRATGGLMYRSADPRTIGNVMLDAIGKRTCRPAC